MSGDLLIQYLAPYSDWHTANRIADGAKMNGYMVRMAMEELKRMRPDSRVRAVDEDGRIVDILG